MNANRSLTAEQAVSQINQTASPGDYFNAMDLDVDAMNRDLAMAEDDRAVQEEMEELEFEQPGTLAAMFPASKDKELGTAHERCKRLRAAVAAELGFFMKDPHRGAMRLGAMMTNTLKASLVGPPIEWMPAYQPIYPLVLMRSAPKDFKAAISGADPIQYETPISRGEAYNVDLSGQPKTIEVTGSNSTIYPYFKTTPAYTIEFYEWARRLIKPMVVKKRQLIQELNYGWDADLITAFDAAVPDGSLYSGHTTHTKTVSNALGVITQSKFREAGDLLLHADSASGTTHMGVPGVAVCDPLAIRDIRAWGNDVWTEEEVSQIAKNGFGVKYDGSVIVGKNIDGYSLVQMPIEHATVYRKVRFFAQKRQIGYFIPITYQGKNIHVRVMPSTSGGDPDWDKISNSQEPPGFNFTMRAHQGGAMQIIGYLNTAMITH